jgi:rubrerythrin
MYTNDNTSDKAHDNAIIIDRPRKIKSSITTNDTITVIHDHSGEKAPAPKRPKLVFPFNTNKLTNDLQTLVKEVTDQNQAIKNKYENLSNLLLKQSEKANDLEAPVSGLVGKPNKLKAKVTALQNELLGTTVKFHELRKDNDAKGVEVLELRNNLEDRKEKLVEGKDTIDTLLGIIKLIQQSKETQEEELKKLEDELNEHKNKDKGRMCTICLDEYACMLAYPCSHLAGCINCITTYHRQANKCPICRAPVDIWSNVYF